MNVINKCGSEFNDKDLHNNIKALYLLNIFAPLKLSLSIPYTNLHGRHFVLQYKANRNITCHRNSRCNLTQIQLQKITCNFQLLATLVRSNREALFDPLRIGYHNITAFTDWKNNDLNTHGYNYNKLGWITQENVGIRKR